MQVLMTGQIRSITNKQLCTAVCHKLTVVKIFKVLNPDLDSFGFGTPAVELAYVQVNRHLVMLKKVVLCYF